MNKYINTAHIMSVSMQADWSPLCTGALLCTMISAECKDGDALMNPPF